MYDTKLAPLAAVVPVPVPVLATWWFSLHGVVGRCRRAQVCSGAGFLRPCKVGGLSNSVGAPPMPPNLCRCRSLVLGSVAPTPFFLSRQSVSQSTLDFLGNKTIRRPFRSFRGQRQCQCHHASCANTRQHPPRHHKGRHPATPMPVTSHLGTPLAAGCPLSFAQVHDKYTAPETPTSTSAMSWAVVNCDL